VYVHSRSWNDLEPYPTEKNGKVYPLKLLKEGDATHAVLSIGGNDARAAFIEGSFDLVNIYNIMIKYGIVEDFEKLVAAVIEHVPKLMLVYVYHPQITLVPFIWGLPPAYVVKELLIKFSPLFIGIAKKYRLPLLDLSRTFDPHDGSDYGTTPIEPSNKSGFKIAKLVEHVIENFKFGEDEAKIYWGSGDNIKSENLSKWDEEKYRVELEKHLEECKQNDNSICIVS